MPSQIPVPMFAANNRLRCAKGRIVGICVVSSALIKQYRYPAPTIHFKGRLIMDGLHAAHDVILKTIIRLGFDYFAEGKSLV